MPEKHFSASQSFADLEKFVEKKVIFRQEQLKKHYKAIREATNKFKKINLGNWSSQLENIQKEPEYDFNAPTDAETQKSAASPNVAKSRPDFSFANLDSKEVAPHEVYQNRPQERPASHIIA